MRLSVLIPTLNEEEMVADAIASVVRGDWSALPLEEVIVSDGGSHDHTVAIAQQVGARVVTGGRGRGLQLRRAAAAATGDVVLMLHADNRLPAAAGEQIAAALGDPRVVVGAFQQRIEAEGRLFRWLEAGNAYRAKHLGLPYGDQALFLRRSALEAVGGMPDLPLMEDVALMQRLGCLRRQSDHRRPALLPGPVAVSARRWQQAGVVRQTARNWALLAAFACGVPAEKLVAWYSRPQDAPSKTPEDAG